MHNTPTAIEITIAVIGIGGCGFYISIHVIAVIGINCLSSIGAVGYTAASCWCDLAQPGQSAFCGLRVIRCIIAIIMIPSAILQITATVVHALYRQQANQPIVGRNIRIVSAAGFAIGRAGSGIIKLLNMGEIPILHPALIASGILILHFGRDRRRAAAIAVIGGGCLAGVGKHIGQPVDCFGDIGVVGLAHERIAARKNLHLSGTANASGHSLRKGRNLLVENG